MSDKWRAWAERNREHLREYERAKHARIKADPELNGRRLEQSRQAASRYKKRHPEWNRRSNKIYRERHPDHVREKKREWRAGHPRVWLAGEEYFIHKLPPEFAAVGRQLKELRRAIRTKRGAHL